MLSKPELVGDEQQGPAALADRARQQPHDALRALVIKISRRLVSQHESRIVGRAGFAIRILRYLLLTATANTFAALSRTIRK
jgi:hypothetical protein